MGTVFVVATPIGNLEDVTLRALRILSEVRVIAAEDTRTTRVLLRRHNVRNRLTALTEHNTARAVPLLLSELEHGDVALVSDAGTPVVSDPGEALIHAAIRAGHSVSPVPGPSALLAALVTSGIATQEFTFLGFLPRAGGARRQSIRAMAADSRTSILFESPHRLRATLCDMTALLGERRIAVCRELTKLHEEIFRGTAAEALDHFQLPRGEFTLVIAGGSAETPVDEAGAVEALAALKRTGAGARDASEIVSKSTGLSRRYLYSLWRTLTDA
jgi:16S rRNA (cytidine1402-2'-O)-methyltransferase